MSLSKDVKLHDEIAEDYDALAKKSGSNIHEIIYKMCSEYITAGDCLLDIGIGTGLGSEPFAKAGLIVYGFDSSKKMLEQCSKKDFAKQIKKHDIQNIPFPYADNSFPLIICCGVLHILRDFKPVIKEAFRLLKPRGIFAFSIISLKADSAVNAPDCTKQTSDWNTLYYKHSDYYVERTAAKLNFKVLKKQTTLSKSGNKDADDFPLKIFVIQK